MRYSKLFGKTSKTAPHDADSVNARLLVQGGFVSQLMAGVYSYLPLGLRVLDKIKSVIREEMNSIGSQEVLMPALQPKDNWAVTGRWENPGPEVMFQFKGRSGKEMGLGWTHEEIVTPLVGQFVRSYKDLPVAVYQIQDKFRNEPRAKSGLMRGREFSMKDLYSFHRDEADLEKFYEVAKQAYTRVYDRCGLHSLIVEADGGAFSKYSHEFQVLADSGEDTVYYCGSCEYAQNKEISEYKAGDVCPKCGGEMKEGRAVEVGNIFPLKTKFSEPFGVTYMDESGVQQPVIMGCYGIGPSRVLGTVVELHHDDRGIVWPKEIAPFGVQLVMVPGRDDESTGLVKRAAEELERDLIAAGVEVLYDDREDVRAGEKFADADLIGLPLRIVVSPKTMEAGSFEFKGRSESEPVMVPSGEAVNEALRRLK